MAVTRRSRIVRCRCSQRPLHSDTPPRPAVTCALYLELGAGLFQIKGAPGAPGVAIEGVGPVTQEATQRNDLIISYVFLRQIVGCVGSLLPIALITGNLMFSATVRESISGYYYTPMRNVFVGALCALGVFLIAYDDHDKLERWVTDGAGLCAILVAFC